MDWKNKDDSTKEALQEFKYLQGEPKTLAHSSFSFPIPYRDIIYDNDLCNFNFYYRYFRGNTEKNRILTIFSNAFFRDYSQTCQLIFISACTCRDDLKTRPYCSNAFSYPRILFPHNMISIIVAVYRPIMQANSAILEGVFVVQLWTNVGSNGIATGDHRTRIMPTNPRILKEEKKENFESSVNIWMNSPSCIMDE